MKEYILALDQGTTSSRAVLVDRFGKIIGINRQEFQQIYPRAGWVEHNPQEIWESQLEAARQVMQAHHIVPQNIAAIGISNQRETIVAWDRQTGEPIAHAIVWQCRRTADLCAELKSLGLSEKIQDKTGLMIDPYFSGTKIRWILDHVSDASKRAKQGDLIVGTIDTWLLWKLSGGTTHATDPSNASRTMLYNIHQRTWDHEILEALDIPFNLLPSVKPSSGLFAVTDAKLLGAEIPIFGIAGDQQAALFGQTCFHQGHAKATYGTGAFLLMHTGEHAVRSKNGLLTTIAWQIGDKTEYALEGSVFIAGALIQWLRDELGLIKSASETEVIARNIVDSAGVYIVPAFVGLGAPYWDEGARGAIVGLTRGSGKKHIVRAALEAIAYQVKDVFEAMKDDAGFDLLELKVDGGAATNDFLMQFQSDMLGVSLKRPSSLESTALGAAYLAGLGAGVWKNQQEIEGHWSVDRSFSPEIDLNQRDSIYTGWKMAVRRVRN